MSMHDLFLGPFADYAFMRRALAAGLILSISGVPLGQFMNLRRMALAGDAMSHAVLPGVALAFLLFGLQLWPMAIGGIATGAAVALAVSFLGRFTKLKEDASFALIYLLSIAGGVLLISLRGNSVDLLHMLFGNILAIDNDALALITGIGCATLVLLAVMYRALVVSCFDPDFIEAGNGKTAINTLFYVLLVTNLVAAFQVLGTLMALGLMLLPAIATRFWTQSLDRAMGLGIAIASFSVYAGLLISYHTRLASGPAVVLTAGVICLLSVFFGKHGSVMAGLRSDGA